MSRLKFAAALLKSKMGRLTGDRDAPVRRDLARAHGQIRRYTDQLRSRLDAMGNADALEQLDAYVGVNTALEAVLERRVAQSDVTAERCRGLSLSIQAGITENLEKELNMRRAIASLDSKSIREQHAQLSERSRSNPERVKRLDALDGALVSLEEVEFKAQRLRATNERAIAALRDAVDELTDGPGDDEDAWDIEEGVIVTLEQAVAQAHQPSEGGV